MISAVQGFSKTKILGSQRSHVYKGGVRLILRQSLSGFLHIIPHLIRQDFDFIFAGFFGQLLVQMLAPLLKNQSSWICLFSNV